MLYYIILNYIPAILYFILQTVSININFDVFAIIYILVQPLYLLLVNIVFVYKKTILFTAGVTYAESVIIFNFLCTIILHKIKTGEFVGDVPIGIYFIMLLLPTFIFLSGTGIFYLLKKKNKI